MNPFEKYFQAYQQEGVTPLDGIPEVANLNALEILTDLELSHHECIADIISLRYEAKAPELFPAVRQRIIDSGYAKRHNMLHSKVEHAGTPNEKQTWTMGFYNNRLQISLSVSK